jgi:hypothetical protein
MVCSTPSHSTFHPKQRMGTSASNSAVSKTVSLRQGCFNTLSRSILLLALSLFGLSEQVQCIRNVAAQLPHLPADGNQLRNTVPVGQGFPIVGAESIMCAKAHGTCPSPVQADLRWNCDRKTADNICCFNRHYAGQKTHMHGITLKNIS